jgi:CBS domain containing-hemolysin-like protein
LDVHSIGGLLCLAVAALLTILTAAAQAPRRPLRSFSGSAETTGRATFWLALELARLAWIALAITSLCYLLLRAQRSVDAAIAAGLLGFTAFALLDGVTRCVVSADPVRWRERTRGVFVVLSRLFWLQALLIESLARAIVASIPAWQPHPQPEEENLAELVEREESKGGIEPEERAMIRAVFALGDTTVREIMVPRIDIVAAEAQSSLEDVAALIAEHGYSRIPIYDGSIDNIVGVVHAKDVLRALARHETVSLRALARAPLYVPEAKLLDELLEELRAHGVQIAIVVDEYGGTAGLVTLEDVVEEIVGDIQDEHDRREPAIVRNDDGSALIDARESVSALDELFGVEIESDDFDTIGGLVIHALGRLPVAGDHVRAYGLDFQVVSVTGRRVRRVRVWRPPPSPAAPAGVAQNGGSSAHSANGQA